MSDELIFTSRCPFAVETTNWYFEVFMMLRIFEFYLFFRIQLIEFTRKWNHYFATNFLFKKKKKKRRMIYRKADCSISPIIPRNLCSFFVENLLCSVPLHVSSIFQESNTSRSTLSTPCLPLSPSLITFSTLSFAQYPYYFSFLRITFFVARPFLPPPRLLASPCTHRVFLIVPTK